MIARRTEYPPPVGACEMAFSGVKGQELLHVAEYRARGSLADAAPAICKYTRPRQMPNDLSLFSCLSVQLFIYAQ